MKIGISGASGHLGSSTIRALKDRLPGGSEIVGISRTPDKVTNLGVEARPGDFDKPEALIEAFRGLDKLLLIPTDNLTPGVRSKQLRDAVEKAILAEVGHVVLMSALGARAAEAPHLWETFFVPEQMLMKTAPKWSIIRMAYYAESFLDEVAMSLDRGVHASIAPTPVNFVARDDVAAAAAGLLASSNEHHGAIYQATGPDSLDGHGRASVIAGVTKRPFAFAEVTLDQYREGLEGAGLPAPMLDAVLSIQEMWACGGFDVVTGDVARLAGRAPRKLENVARDRFG